MKTRELFNKKEISYKEFFQMFNFVVIVLFILFSLLDIFVTYYFYRIYGTNFYNLEGNKILVWSLKNHIPYFLTPDAIINFLLLIPFVKSIKMFNYKNTINRARFLLFMTLIITILTTGHLIGALGWFGL